MSYTVALESDLPHPILKDEAGEWVWPVWLTLEETAAVLGYERTSSLRVAVRQGRLESQKRGGVHYVHRDELQAARDEGRLKPRRK